MTSLPALLSGARRPRVELRPATAAYTLGPEACELAALAGIEPEPWQADALDILLGVRVEEDIERWACREYAEIVGRQQGKSIGIGLPRALFGLLVLRERRIYWSAHRYNTSQEAFLQARDALYRLGEDVGNNAIAFEEDDGVLLVKVSNTNGDEGFELWSGSELLSRWRFWTRSTVGGRGHSGDLNIVDEAFAYTQLQRRALAPTLLARPNPQSVYLSSPPLDGETGDVLFALAARAARGVRNLGFRDWGLELLLDDLDRMSPAERGAFLDDRANWVAALPALGGPRVTEEAVQQLRDEFEGDDLGFATEVLCLWPRQTAAGQGWSVIAEQAWRNRSGAAGRPEGPAFALDASWPDAAMGAIAVSGRLGAELSVDVVEHRPGTGWMVERAVQLRERNPRAVFVVDPRSPAGHLIEPLEDEGVAVRTTSAADVAHAFGAFVTAITGETPTLRHYGQPELDAAVKAAGTRPLGDGRMWTRQGAVDISPLTAATLAAWAAARRARSAPPAPVMIADADREIRTETADLLMSGF